MLRWLAENHISHITFYILQFSFSIKKAPWFPKTLLSLKIYSGYFFTSSNSTSVASAPCVAPLLGAPSLPAEGPP